MMIAYIGPGPGLAMLGALLGLVVTILVALGAVLLWPIRKLMNREKEKDGEDKGDGDESKDASEESPQESSGDRDRDAD